MQPSNYSLGEIFATTNWDLEKREMTDSLIHSFIQAISIAPLQVHYYSEALPTGSTQLGYCVGVSREAPQATASEGLAQGPYVAARTGSDERLRIYQ